MTSTLCTCTWLLLPCCVLVALSTGELDFYRDEIPESSESIALRQLIRYLEGQRPRYPPLHKKHYADLEREKERDLFEALMDKGSLTELLRKPKEWEYRQARYNDPPINELKPARERYVPPFYESKPPFDSPPEYSSLKLSSFPGDAGEDDTSFRDDDYGYNGRVLPLERTQYEEETGFDRGMKEEPLLDFHRNHGGVVHQDGDTLRQKPSADLPDFTFKFDPPNLHERHPFAVKPNNPKYYEDDSRYLEDLEKLDTLKPSSNDTKWERESTVTEEMHASREGNSRLESKFKDASVIVVPEIERRTEYNPVFVPVNQDLNNDIYGFAVVAGCIAASVFLLVLIALTWYRIHRSTKDAADIEYPAYGVTGPNKEISPSGDQRLAQSAQMYHFQHQKQQIIAMEKDPGSVSEADSEEENEEGDYTVYECPGLASTGEMEVKNPLFHDDPTPATPAQINKEEDHNI